MHKEILDRFCKAHGLKLHLDYDTYCSRWRASVAGSFGQPVYSSSDSTLPRRKDIFFAVKKRLLEFMSSSSEEACKLALDAVLKSSRLVFFDTRMRLGSIDISRIKTLDQLEIMTDLMLAMETR